MHSHTIIPYLNDDNIVVQACEYSRPPIILVRTR